MYVVGVACPDLVRTLPACSTIRSTLRILIPREMITVPMRAYWRNANINLDGPKVYSELMVDELVFTREGLKP